MKVTNGASALKYNPQIEKDHFSDTRTINNCPITDVLDRISDKWTMHVIVFLGTSEKLRFTEIKNKIGSISPRMLTVTLRTLEEDGFVTRTIYAQIPPRVEYKLTPLGQSLLTQLISLSSWANENMSSVFQAREEYQLKKNDL